MAMGYFVVALNSDLGIFKELTRVKFSGAPLPSLGLGPVKCLYRWGGGGGGGVPSRIITSITHKINIDCCHAGLHSRTHKGALDERPRKGRV